MIIACQMIIACFWHNTYIFDGNSEPIQSLVIYQGCIVWILFLGYKNVSFIFCLSHPDRSGWDRQNNCTSHMSCLCAMAVLWTPDLAVQVQVEPQFSSNPSRGTVLCSWARYSHSAYKWDNSKPK